MARFRTRTPRMSSSRKYARAHQGSVRGAGGRFTTGWGVAWQGIEDVSARIIETNEQLHADIAEMVEDLAREIEDHMKREASWTDHPGDHADARENLQAAVVWQGPEQFTIMLGHGANVVYGIWLEVRWGGRYAIVVPTAELYGAQLAGRLAAGRY